MITKTSLIQSLNDAFFLAIHTAYANGIHDDVMNIKLKGIYTGTVGGNPDPLSGEYQFSMLLFPIDGSDMRDAVSGSPVPSIQTWFDYIEGTIRLIQFSPISDDGVVTSNTLTCMSGFDLEFDSDIEQAQDYQQALGWVAQYVSDSMIAHTFGSSSFEATSSGGGVGTLTNLELI